MAEPNPNKGNALASWAKLKKVVADQAQATYEQVQQNQDLELGDGVSQWASWAKAAASRARSNLEQAAEKAKTSDWTTDLASTFGKVSESASAGAKAAGQKATTMAGSAKDNIAGMGSLAMNPVKLMQAGGIFMLGMFLISLSFSFLPLLPIQPQKFALLFALGSMTMLGSAAWLKGPAAFLGAMFQRDKLGFSICYIVGLCGTLWATLIARSYLWTCPFALMQAVGLLYFLASYVPGGQSLLNRIGRCCGSCARSLLFKR